MKGIMVYSKKCCEMPETNNYQESLYKFLNTIIKTSVQTNDSVSCRQRITKGRTAVTPNLKRVHYISLIKLSLAPTPG